MIELNTIQVGDKLKCICANRYYDDIQEGKVYTVKLIAKDYRFWEDTHTFEHRPVGVLLEEGDYMYRNYQFDHVTDFINNTNLTGN